MEMKFIEIRDTGTTIAALAIRMISDVMEGPRGPSFTFLRREGYPSDGSAIVLMRLADQKTTVDPYAWPELTGGRTMAHAHNWIIDNWHSIASGQVVDVQCILGETDTPKLSEIMPRLRTVAGVQPPSIEAESPARVEGVEL